ncbi:hypothetical protein EVAR_29871_1 [Eumeta japonica]|uniref:Uncharacterized protein n=1 Tax=Eumeta variegata TaxID=151549 RepID=A0A4C1V7M0_EUMVA|nr:hypothetical protein EVAR_29871_1 [Eumeta japonica]
MLPIEYHMPSGSNLKTFTKTLVNPFSGTERASEPQSRWPSLPIDTRNLSGVVSTLLASWVRIGHLMEVGLVEGEWGDVGRVSHRNSHLLDETQQWKQLLRTCIL